MLAPRTVLASLGDVPEPLCPSFTSLFSMTEGPLFPSQSSCVTTSPVLKPRQLSFEVSLSDRFGNDLQDTAFGPWNLQTKKIMAFWLNRVEDCGPTSAKQPSNRKWKKLDKSMLILVVVKQFDIPVRESDAAEFTSD